MSSKGAELIRLAERGERVEMVRATLGLNGEDFAKAVNHLAAQFGFDSGYDKSKLSRLEAGKQTFLPAEEAVIIAMLDPDDRGVNWLVFGDRRDAQNVDLTRVEAVPAVAARKSAKARR